MVKETWGERWSEKRRSVWVKNYQEAGKRTKKTLERKRKRRRRRGRE